MSELTPTQLPLPGTEGPSSQHRSAPERRDPASRWFVVIAGGIGTVVGVTAMLVLGREVPPAPKESSAVAQVTSKRESSTIVEQAPPPTWLGSRKASWTRDGSKTIGFELQSSNEVPIWMTRTRPFLVVRCLSHTTEVFVVTGAASIEPQSGVHTVRLQIDDEEAVLQQWVDSESRQELFAPNSIALTKRLAQAQRVRFGFTPYNATPVVADFVVEGFDKLAGLVADTCGWKLDAADNPKTQAARLN